MKKKNILFATCLLGAFAFSSCEKNLYDESKQSEKEIKMTDLNIPEDFQWNLTQVTKGTTIANTQTKVSLFLDEKCSKDEKVATIPVYNKAINLPLSLPTYVKTIYAQYQSKSGKMITKSVAVNANGSYTLNIPDAIEANPTRAITRDNNKKDDEFHRITYVIEDTILKAIDGRGLLGRLDDFKYIIAIKNINNEVKLRAFLEHIRTQISWHCKFIDSSYNIEFSIGIGRYPDNGKDLDLIKKKIQKAINIAHSKGGNRYIIYKEFLHGEIEDSDK